MRIQRKTFLHMDKVCPNLREKILSQPSLSCPLEVTLPWWKIITVLCPCQHTSSQSWCLRSPGSVCALTTQGLSCETIPAWKPHLPHSRSHRWPPQICTPQQLRNGPEAWGGVTSISHDRLVWVLWAEDSSNIFFESLGTGMMARFWTSCSV